MSRLTHLLASTRTTLAGFALLAAAVIGMQYVPQSQAPMLAAFALLAVNLAAALATRARLRRDHGLLLLHVALLALLILAGVGRLGRFEARVEVVDGQSLADARIEVLLRGPLYDEAWRDLDFLQGGYTVDYFEGLNRGETRSQVRLHGEARVVGDEEALVLDGHRFYTTHNKGFAALLAWTDARGVVQRGAVHMPGYPRHGLDQSNRLALPGAPVMRLSLDLDAPFEPARAWRLDSRSTRAGLRVEVDGATHELAPGEHLDLPGGRLHYEGLRGWMGYWVFHDPMLAWMALAAALALAGLAWHLIGGRIVTRRRHPTGEGAHVA